MSACSPAGRLVGWWVSHDRALRQRMSAGAGCCLVESSIIQLWLSGGMVSSVLLAACVRMGGWRGTSGLLVWRLGWAHCWVLKDQACLNLLTRAGSSRMCAWWTVSFVV